MLVSLKRILKFGWQGFCRNKGLTIQVVFIMAVAVFVWTSFFFIRQAGSAMIENVQEKIDIAVYFKKDISEQEILEVKDELGELAHQIERVDYVSKETALENFLEKHQDDSLYIMALEEIEDNPFLASLNIKAKAPGQYSQISAFLSQDIFNSLIERISYNKNREVIDKLFAIIANVKTLGILSGAFLTLLVVLITFNTIKLSIFSSKEEISTMRLVGAHNWFIRGPFLTQGILYALFAVLVVDIVFLGCLIFLRSQLSNWFLGLDFLVFFKQNILVIGSIQLISAILLGGLSTLLAVRKYLKV